jgi:hypothetical protein
MRKRSLAMLTPLLILASLTTTLSADLSVMIDGQRRTEYNHRGTTYIEAVRGREYSLRITNPTGHRVAVALSVDGLNTIDAKHTDGWTAAKWVLEPYASAEISGWQVSGTTARRFFFTGERNSYGTALGKTENLGVIEAIFYREKGRPITRFREESRDSQSSRAPSSAPKAEAETNDEYAATGMGDRTRHEIEHVAIDLDPHPIESVRIRYEFRPQLVRLGVLRDSPLDRREKARGFTYCPEP